MTHTSREDHHVGVPGGRVFLRRWTPASARLLPPVLLLHDSLGCVELWRDFPARLAGQLGREVLAYDRLGFGRSTPRQAPPSPRFIEEEAETVFPALSAALGLQRLVLLGHSVGGSMAVTIAARDPARCAALITLSAQTHVEQRTLDGIRAAQRSFAEPAQMDKLRRLHGDRAPWVLAAWTDSWLSPAFADWSLRPRLAELRCPLLALHGDQDEFGSCAFPRTIARCAGGASRAVILDGIGHVPQRECPERLVQEIRAFLADADASSG